MTVPERPSWQLPAGVSRGTWDYVNESTIATEYDRFHAGHPLLDLDKRIVAETLPQETARSDGSTRLIVDVGCGPGRNLIPLAERGYQVLGVDLSQDMLDEFSRKAALNGLSDRCGFLRANMADLRCLQDSIADGVLCMYSSLGMVRGRANRRAFLSHAHRILRREGCLIVHVHNRGSWLRDPGGVRRTISDWCRERRDKSWELGDRIYPYRGLPSMFLHIYSEQELRADIESAGLKITTMHRLNRESSGLLRSSWFSHLRAGGFIAIAHRVR
ncbi:Glycine/sarcosine N-methyltransferase [Pirellula sp. SH-Sr6A]|uniref:class I SAM-dependent methyltransferase n=1 Tax=Pirellula sp. SH-Sr6A TaxID=1632865 RepID=UPI00078CB783|nr:class I SAM-dependent methyltransferase [Pirellula sp. SH-Sr6A]AMV33229.1 Glycine/sarcosine N-methyltransferase [Pirellula sp. SH-Sr6A]